MSSSFPVVFLRTYRRMAIGEMFQEPSFPLLLLSSQKICRYRFWGEQEKIHVSIFWTIVCLLFFPCSRLLYMLFSAQNALYPLFPQHMCSINLAQSSSSFLRRAFLDPLICNYTPLFAYIWRHCSLIYSLLSSTISSLRAGIIIFCFVHFIPSIWYSYGPW